MRIQCFLLKLGETILMVHSFLVFAVAKDKEMFLTSMMYYQRYLPKKLNMIINKIVLMLRVHDDQL